MDRDHLLVPEACYLIDVGGTSTRVARCRAAGGRLAPAETRVYESRAYPSLEAILRDDAARTGFSGKSAVIGVPGPVVDGAARATNLPWVIDAADLQRALGLSGVRLLNDVEALGHAIAGLGPGDIEVIHPGRPRAGYPAALIAPGTGLGEAFVTPEGDACRVWPSEGGHADFAPATALEVRLLAHLRNRWDRVSCERVCSGPGIYTLYRFLKEEGICPEPAWLRKRLAAAHDPVEAIARNALSGGEAADITVRTIELFLSILGAEAGNMALRFNARAGIYIGGGVALKILPLANKKGMAAAFHNKGRLSAVVSEIPLMLIRKANANLYGLAEYARNWRMPERTADGENFERVDTCSSGRGSSSPQPRGDSKGDQNAVRQKRTNP